MYRAVAGLTLLGMVNTAPAYAQQNVQIDAQQVVGCRSGIDAAMNHVHRMAPLLPEKQSHEVWFVYLFPPAGEKDNKALVDCVKKGVEYRSEQLYGWPYTLKPRF